jgi:hypothetical protein
MLVIGEWLIKRSRKIEGHLNFRLYSTLLSSVFAMILLLHLGEITLWAVVYDQFGLLNDFRISLDFSVGSYTTNSAPGIQLPGSWKLLGQLESISGPLLVGLSTAFLFLVMRKLFEMRRIEHEEGRLA